MNVHIFLFAWFAVGVACVAGLLWFMKTHEKQLMEDMPAAQIFGCIPPPAKWVAILIFLFFGPVVLLWGLWEAIEELREGKDGNSPGGGRSVAEAPVIPPEWIGVALFALVCAVFGAYHWAIAGPDKPDAKFWVNQARGIGINLGLFALVGVLATRKPLWGLQLPLMFVPFYFVALVPPAVSPIMWWRGGWVLGTLGAVAGGAAGVVGGRVFGRWILPGAGNLRERGEATSLPVSFAVLFALYGAHNWAIAWATLDHVWWIGIFWLLLAIPGALVGRPILGLLVVSPLVLVPLVPPTTSLIVNWAGGWVLGVAGAAAGGAAGALTGWLFKRWILPEYDKRRARQGAVQPPSQE
jgi:hypothetical protein